jgi:hypothetical protein
MRDKPFRDGKWRDVDALPAPLRRAHDKAAKAAREAREAEREGRLRRLLGKRKNGEAR